MRADGRTGKKGMWKLIVCIKTNQIVKKGDKADCFSETATVSDPWDQLVVIVINGIFLLSSLRAPLPRRLSYECEDAGEIALVSHLV